MSVFTSEVVVDNTVLVDGSAVTQPVSAVSLPLPTGAATDAAVLALTKPSDTQLVDGSAHTQPVSGTVAVSGSVAVTGPLTDAELRATPVPISGSVSTTPVVSSSSTVTQVTSTGSNQTILAANASRKKAILFFESGIWYVKYGAGASASSLTFKVSSGSTTIEVTTWTGQIDVLCTSSNKLVDVTELV